MPSDLFNDLPFRGSSLLITAILEQFEIYISRDKAASAVVFSDWLSKTGRTAIKKYPNHVTVRKHVTNLVYYVKRSVKSDSDVKELKKKTLARIKEQKDSINNIRERISEAGAKIIFNQNKILTISYSSVVKDILLSANRVRRKFTVYCAESGPLNEGTRFAEELTSAGIQCMLIKDAATMRTLPEMNLVITGADRISTENYINKIGTHILALGAASCKVPFYVAAETDKILKETEFAVRFYPENPKEVYSGKVRQLKAENYYFESIPLAFVSKIICEDGIFDTQEFMKWYLED